MFKNRKFFASKPFLMPLFAFAFVLALASCGGAGDSGSPDGGDGGSGGTGGGNGGTGGGSGGSGGGSGGAGGFGGGGSGGHAGSGGTGIPGVIGNTSSVGKSIPGAAAKIVGKIAKLRTSSIDFSHSTAVSLKGTSKTKSCNKTKAEITKSEIVGDVTLGAVFYENGCYTNDSYSNQDFLVKKGTIKVPFGDKDFHSFAVYSIEPPTSLAKKFMASPHAVLYHFKRSDVGKSFTINVPGRQKNGVIEMINEGATFKVESEWQQLPITEDQFPIAFFLTPTDQKFELYHPLSSAVGGVEIGTSDIGTENLYQVALDKSITPIGLDDFGGAPGTHPGIYGQNRFFHLIKLSDDSLGIVWQDRIKYSIYLTKFKPTGETSTIELPNSSVKSILGAAAHDASGSVYYFTVGADNPGTANKSKVLSFMVYKVSETGKVILKKELNTSTNTLNMTYAGALFDSKKGAGQGTLDYSNSMKVSGQKVALIFSRTRPKSSDGLNHQSASMLVLDDKFNILTNQQTSSHSFANVLSVASDGSFIGADLGDNYPRGINFHKTYGNSITSKVVYTFKTAHGITPTSPAGATYPPLKDASGNLVHSPDGKPFYAWSNDNQTYTELGSIVEVDKGYMMFFLGEEKSGTGKFLDNSTVNDKAYRGVYYVLVSKDIKGATRSNSTMVNDDLSIAKKLGTHVLPNERGFYYSFGGSRAEQQNAGIVALVPVKKGSGESFSRLSATKRSDGNVLLTWSYLLDGGSSSFKYTKTLAVVVNSKTGKVEHSPTVISSGFNRGHQPLRIGKTTYFVTGDEYKNTLQISTIKEK